MTDSPRQSPRQVLLDHLGVMTSATISDVRKQVDGILADLAAEGWEIVKPAWKNAPMAYLCPNCHTRPLKRMADGLYACQWCDSRFVRTEKETDS